MNPRSPEEVFAINEIVGNGATLFLPNEGARVRLPLMKRISALPAGARLVIDFSNVRVASEAARNFLVMALRTIGGDSLGRSLVLDKLGPSRYSVKVMLQNEKLTAVARREGKKGADLLGRDEQGAVADTYAFLTAKGSATAADVRDHFDLKSTSVATNRLVALADRGLAVRVAQEPLDS